MPNTENADCIGHIMQRLPAFPHPPSDGCKGAHREHGQQDHGGETEGYEWALRQVFNDVT